MLRITIPAREWYNDETGEFVTIKEQTLTLEHSLVSLSKWESQFKRPFLGREPKTISETVAYIKCMTLTQNVDPIVYLGITNEIVTRVNEYIDDPMTATWFSKGEKATASRQVVTAEIVYYWMIALGIPFECQKWHLNRLMTLIRVCNAKSQPPKKIGKKALAARNASLNAARRKAAHTKG